MDGVLWYQIIPTLQHMAATKIVTELLRKELINRLSIGSLFHVEEIGNVNCKIDSLPVPPLIQNKLSYIVEPIGDEIEKWVTYHFTNIKEHVCWSKYCDKLQWTSRGRVDYRESAKLLLCEDLNCETKKFISDFYWLDESKSFIDGLEYSFWYLSQPIPYWQPSTGKRNQFSDKHLADLFGCALKFENETAMRYLWKRLTDEGKNNILLTIELRVINNDMICFLLSQMDEEQQKRAFIAASSHILEQFARDWLCAAHFLPTILNNIPVVDYLLATWMILHHTKCKSMSFHIFEIIWKSSPSHLKDCIINSDFHLSDILYKCLSAEPRREDLAKEILSDANDAQKKRFAHSGHGLRMCCRMISERYWDAFLLFAQLMFANEEGLSEFKRVFLKQNGFRLCIKLIENASDRNCLDQFLFFFLESEEQINHYKHQIPSSEKGMFFFISKLCSIETTDHVDILLDYCFQSEEDTQKFKEALFQDINNVDIKIPYLIQMIRRSKELMDKFLSRVFSRNP